MASLLSYARLQIVSPKVSTAESDVGAGGDGRSLVALSGTFVGQGRWLVKAMQCRTVGTLTYFGGAPGP